MTDSQLADRGLRSECDPRAQSYTREESVVKQDSKGRQVDRALDPLCEALALTFVA